VVLVIFVEWVILSMLIVSLRLSSESNSLSLKVMSNLAYYKQSWRHYTSYCRASGIIYKTH
jgi:hypothetical protein